MSYLNAVDYLSSSCLGQPTTADALHGKQPVYKYTALQAIQCPAVDHHLEELKKLISTTYKYTSKNSYILHLIAIHACDGNMTMDNSNVTIIMYQKLSLNRGPQYDNNEKVILYDEL